MNHCEARANVFTAVGVIIGFIYGKSKPRCDPAWKNLLLTFAIGTVSIFRYGAGTQGIMRTLGQYMGASGATFG